ncbi:MAG: fatty acid desaturase family protein [Streptosporangiaceae bacterium]
MHVISSWAVLHGPARLGRRAPEGGLLLVHFAGYLTAVALLMPPAQAIAFIVVQQGLFGVYLGCAFAPNHKGMPVLGEQDSLDFLRRQVLTSRNVTGGPLVETLLGGLNYQIEHHLFPSMPRPSLRRCRALVRVFCAQHELAYCELNLVASYAQVLRALHGAGRGDGPRAPRSPLRAGRWPPTAAVNPAAAPGRPAAAPAAGRNPPGRCPAAR